jgi:hypothetical protein
MRIVWTEGNCWPNPMQELVLRAALLDGEPAREAWQQFCDREGLDNLDHGSFRTLPLVYRNLARHAPDHAQLGMLRGVHRRAWYETKTLFRGLTPTVEFLREAGIPLLLLKGAPMATLYYRDLGLRPMHDLDVLVPEDRAVEAIGMLEARGFTRLTTSPRRISLEYLRFRHSIGFRHAEAGDLDLHWHLILQACYPGADEPFWSAAVPLDFEGVPVLALCPTDQLFHTLVHGVQLNEVPPMRWVTDAFQVIRGGGDIDWDRMLAMGQRLRVLLLLRDGLQYLVEKFEAPVPLSVLEALCARHPSRAERLAHERTLNPRRLQSPVETVLALWHAHASSNRDRSAIARMLGFRTFLRFYWNCEGPPLGLLPRALRWIRWRVGIVFSRRPAGQLT